MALNSMGLGFAFTARDMASGTMQKISTQIKGLSDQSKELEKRYEAATGSIKKGAGIAAIGIGGLVAVNKATKAFADFDTEITGAGLKMGATAEQLKQLRKVGLKMGQLTEFSPAEAAKGLAELGAQGLTAKQSMVAIRPVLDLAAASMGQLGVADAATTATAAMNAFGIKFSKGNLTRVLDAFTNVANKSAFQMRDFQVAVSSAAAQAAAGGQSFNSMLTQLGLLRNAGLGASRAATSYREAVRRIATDPGAIKALKKMGVNARDSSGKMRDMSKIIGDVKRATDKMKAADRDAALQKVFGARGLATYNAQIKGYEKLQKEGKAKVGEFTAAHDRLLAGVKKEGTLKAQVNKVNKTAGKQYKLLKGSWETFVIQMGSLFVKYVVPVLKFLIDGLNKIVAVIDGMPSGLKDLIGGFIAFGSVALVLLGTFKMLRGVWQLFTLGRMAGQFVAGQTAMATATRAQTTALTQQAAAGSAAAASQSKLGRLAGMAGKAVGVAALAFGAWEVGKQIGNSFVKWWYKSEIAAQKAEEKIVNFKSALTSLSVKLMRQRGFFSKHRIALRKWTMEMVKAADKSSKAAEGVLKRVTLSMGDLAIRKEKLLRKLALAIKRRDTKAALSARANLENVTNKMQALEEARLHIRAKQQMRELKNTKDMEKQQTLAKTIALSMTLKQITLDRAYQAWKKKAVRGLNAIEDPKERARQAVAFRKEDAARMATLMKGRRKILAFADKYAVGEDSLRPLQGKGDQWSAQDWGYFASRFQKLLPGALKLATTIGSAYTFEKKATSDFKSSKFYTRASKGYGHLSPSKIREFSQMAGAQRYAEVYGKSRKQLGGLTRAQESSRAAQKWRIDAAQFALQQHSRGERRFSYDELEELRRMAKQPINVNVNIKGDLQADVKGDARTGKRLRVSTRKRGTG